MDLKKTNAAQTTETYNKEVIEEKTNTIILARIKLKSVILSQANPPGISRL